MPEIDRHLHRERIKRRQKVTWHGPVEALPDGAFYEHEGQVFLVWQGAHWRWAFEGYEQAEPCRSGEVVEVLAPESTVRAFRAGFKPLSQLSLA